MQNKKGKMKKHFVRVTFCLFNFAFCICIAGCDQKQQVQLEKQVEGVASSVQKSTALAIDRTLQETMSVSQSGAAAWRVKTALSVSSRLEGAQIDVELQGQKIILHGSVQTVGQKKIAQSIAQNTLDPKFTVVNRLSAISDFSRKPSSYEQSRRAAR